MKSVNEVFEFAEEVAKHAYVPYSNFHVGAAILLKNDTVIAGCNIENASYGLSCCAERNTLFQVYAKGYSKDDIVFMCLVADFPGKALPCGACRQVMVELMNKDCKVYMKNKDGSVDTKTVEELLPFGFNKEDLHG